MLKPLLAKLEAPTPSAMAAVGIRTEEAAARVEQKTEASIVKLEKLEETIEEHGGMISELHGLLVKGEIQGVARGRVAKEQIRTIKTMWTNKRGQIDEEIEEDKVKRKEQLSLRLEEATRKIETAKVEKSVLAQ